MLATYLKSLGSTPSRPTNILTGQLSVTSVTALSRVPRKQQDSGQIPELRTEDVF